MRIVVTADHWFPDVPSGGSRLAWGHAAGLAREGHEVYLVTEAVGTSEEKLFDADGVRVLQYAKAPLRSLDPRRAVSHQLAVDSLLTRHVLGPVDAVIGHTLFAHLQALKRYGRTAQSSYTVHSPVRAEYEVAALNSSVWERGRMALAGRLLERFERRALTGSKVLMVDSSFTRRLLAEAHGEEVAERILVIPGWVDESSFVPVEDRSGLRKVLGLPLDRAILFTLRRLVPRMGLEHLIAACGNLRTRGDFILVIGGEGGLRPALEAQAREALPEECVRFLGRVPDEELPSWYAAADAFVLPTSRLECFGLIALEAMAAGRPVLATPVGAIPEVVGRFEKAWLAYAATVEALEELIGNFLAGALPRHDPAQLHDAVVREYGRSVVLPELIAASLGRECHSEGNRGP